jgi:hypothetical protein
MIARVDRAPEEREHRPTTAEVYVNQAAVPVSVTVFTCACGAKNVQGDARSSPSGWTTAADGSDRCPRCARSEADPGKRPA